MNCELPRSLHRLLSIAALIVSAALASVPSHADEATLPIPLAIDGKGIGELRSRLVAELPRIIDLWMEIAGIAAPSGREQPRAERIEREMAALGLEEIRRDEIGNVMGLLRGRAPSTRRIVYAAHLDTVAREGDPAVITRMDPDRLQGPGVRDDASGLVGMIEAVRALRAAGIQPPGDVWIVATVQEEVGLLGARKFLDDNAGRVSRFIAVDGELGDISYGATGIVWLKFHFLAEGGHTLKSRQAPSATLAAARTIEAIYRLDVPDGPESRASWLNIGMLGAGDVVNAMARDAWFSVDLRSNSPKMLRRLEEEIRQAASRGADRTGVDLSVEEVLRMPGAAYPGLRESDLVRLTEAALLAAGYDQPRPMLRGTADHNRALERGIPGICIGVTVGTGVHTPLETASIAALPTGIAALALLMASLPSD